MKVAIVHDWLPVLGGAEQVLKNIIKVYPEADVYTLFDFLSEDEKNWLGAKSIKSSYLNKIPFAKKHYRKLFPFFPQAIEDFDLSKYDLVVSSSSSVAKGVITHAQQVHISYVHSPVRYAWDLMHYYLKQSNLDKGLRGYIIKNQLHKFRNWDYRTANGVDHYIANSGFVAKRIWKVYRREADVIYPPVDINYFKPKFEKDDFYLAASRQVPYKRIDLIVESFTKMPDKKLKVIGDGPDHEKIKTIAKGHSNIEILGFLRNDILKDHMQRAKAFVFAAEEDFGIVPVEAQASGTPVIAYGAGGALETVIGYDKNEQEATGVFFDKQEPTALKIAVDKFESLSDDIDPKNCRKQAEKFSAESFRAHLESYVIAHLS